jgi:phosphoribosylanthranilate isomerase
LRPENVGDAIRLLSPVVVDVSSGVENAPGVKDPVRVQLFVQAVRDAAEKSR